MRVDAINQESPHLEAVKLLWRTHSATLGFLPDGAFRDYAAEGRIIVALDGSEACVGYLIYRTVTDRATIVHFCVASNVRRTGVARALLTRLVQATKHLRGILLSCRADFPANDTWPRLGFYPISQRQGRAGKLTIWWLDYGHSDLFTSAEEPTGIKAVMDANVFFDVVEHRCEESGGLLADWLVPFVTLCYTPELLVELQRSPDPATQARHRVDAQQFCLLNCSPSAFEAAQATLRPLFPNLATPQDESDFRHLARAVGGEAGVFVTRDEFILNRAEEVFETCGLAIVRPGELASRIDTLQQEHLYQRNQVAGTNQIFMTRQSSVTSALVTATKTPSERNHEVKEPLNRFLAEPHRFSLFQVVDQSRSVEAAFVTEHASARLHVPFFRVRDSKRASTLSRTLLTSIVRAAVARRCSHAIIADPAVDAQACSDLGFLRTENGWLKLIVVGVVTTDQAITQLNAIGREAEGIRNALPEARTDMRLASRLEHLLWPGKLSDVPMTSYIVPIQPNFAEHLFDYRLASSNLFGAYIDLALNPESAYYRSAHPFVLSAPARVLWYVCQSDDYERTMSIRACSRIVEVAKGTPKQLFGKFRRLGVYKWSDVLRTAGAIDKELMAFRFDDTELLPPLPWTAFQPTLAKHGIHTTFQSPVRIPPSVFEELYLAALDSTTICGSNSNGNQAS